MFWILQQIVFSLIIILLVHYLYNYLKDSLTTPKIKTISTQDDHHLEELMKKTKEISILDPPILNTNHDKDNNHNEDDENDDDMKNTLKNYIKQLKTPLDETIVKKCENANSNTNGLSTTNINSLPEMN